MEEVIVYFYASGYPFGCKREHNCKYYIILYLTLFVRSGPNCTVCTVNISTDVLLTVQSTNLIHDSLLMNAEQKLLSIYLLC